MLPALVVSDDSGFHNKIEDTSSPQLHWFWKAQVLADAWSCGKRPRPVWLATAADRWGTRAAGKRAAVARWVKSRRDARRGCSNPV